MTDEEFESVFRVNTFSPFYLSRACYRTWFPDGKVTVKKEKIILFVSSMSGLISNLPQTQCAYNASKAAVRRFLSSSFDIRFWFSRADWIVVDDAGQRTSWRMGTKRCSSKCAIARYFDPSESTLSINIDFSIRLYRYWDVSWSYRC